MRRSLLFTTLLLVLVIGNLPGVFSVPCEIGISMINQDPYPAIPGDEVKLLFQVTGLENSECKSVSFQLVEKYPIILSPDQNSTYFINSGTYKRDFESFFLAPFKVRVSEDAIGDENKIEVKYNIQGNSQWVSKSFDLYVQDLLGKFEIYVKSYDPSTHSITFEILNYAVYDFEALRIELPKQENIKVYGSNTDIVGDLDSNEYATAKFTAIPQEGDILLKLHYSDEAGNRKIIEQNVSYDPEYFKSLKTKKSLSFTQIAFWVLVVLLIGYYFYRKHKKRKAFRDKLRK